MSTSRLVIIEQLENTFSKNKESILSHARKQLANKNVDRIFDSFPCLMQDDTYYYYSNAYLVILKTISRTPHTFLEYPDALKEKLQTYFTTIVRMGCHDLLDSTGRIHPSLAEYLGWEGFSDIPEERFIAAYVNQFYQSLSEKFINKGVDEALAEMLIFTESQKQETIKKVFITRGWREDKDQSKKSFLDEHKTAIATTGLAVLGAAATVGITLLSHRTSGKIEGTPGLSAVDTARNILKK